MPTLNWGHLNEDKAHQQYCSLLSTQDTNFEVQLSGLHIDTQHPHLGVTPDSIVSCDYCGVGLIEIKCPFKYKHSVLSDIDDRNFYLQKNSAGMLQLSKHMITTHNPTRPLLDAKTLYDTLYKSFPNAAIFTVVPGHPVTHLKCFACHDQYFQPLIPTFFFNMEFQGHWAKKVGITFVFESSLPLFACFLVLPSLLPWTIFNTCTNYTTSWGCHMHSLTIYSSIAILRNVLCIVQFYI